MQIKYTKLVYTCQYVFSMVYLTSLTTLWEILKFMCKCESALRIVMELILRERTKKQNLKLNLKSDEGQNWKKNFVFIKNVRESSIIPPFGATSSVANYIF